MISMGLHVPKPANGLFPTFLEPPRSGCSLVCSYLCAMGQWFPWISLNTCLNWTFLLWCWVDVDVTTIGAETFNFWLKTSFLLQRWHRHRLSDGPFCHGDVRLPRIWRISMGDGQNRKSNASILNVQKSQFLLCFYCFGIQWNGLESSNFNITTHFSLFCAVKNMSHL